MIGLDQGALVRQEGANRPLWIVAMDGPSGTGKSTVSRGLARRFGARYLDTGAMYRALTWAALHDPKLEVADLAEDASAAQRLISETVLEISTDPDAPAISVNGFRVDGPIREEDVTSSVSAVAAVAALRRWLVAQQRAIIEAQTHPIVVEGRDIGTVVAPDAELKIYLTADESARAARRGKEQHISDTAAVRAEIARRDKLDSSRAVDPLRQADGALVVDTTHLNQQQVMDQLADLLAAAFSPKSP